MIEKSGKIIYKCGHCDSIITSDNVRYSKDAKTIICIDCHNIIFGKKSVSSKMSEIPNPRRDPILDKAVMYCEDCRYRFRAPKNPRKQIRCPGCDSIKISPYETDIEKILKDL